MSPGSTGPGLLPNLVRICDFLFSEPVASRLALDSELGVEGAGHSLSSETLESLLGMFRHDIPHLDEEEARFRAWVILSVVHQCFLRPAGCREWLGLDPEDKASRDNLLKQLGRLAGLPAAAGKE
jgi:hypothetical protein